MNKEKQINWWIKISTTNQKYIYYFGDFDSYHGAELFKKDFMQYLNEEKAKMIDIQIQLTDHKKLVSSTWKKNQKIKGCIVIKKESNSIISLIKLSKLLEINNSYSNISSACL